MIITAQTDTGKTTTILKALSNYSCSFLSDDMTILSPDGWGINFPKPLTISRHTLSVVKDSALSIRERFALQIQGRFHSRSGRRFGMLLGMIGLPAATINTVFQMMVPPPKYPINRLVRDVRIDDWAYLSKVVIIERGLDSNEQIELGMAIEILLKNCEDAYGFPPYPQIEHSLSSWERKDLHSAEREIITTALLGCCAVRMKSITYGWWSRLPEVVQTETCLEFPYERSYKEDRIEGIRPPEFQIKR
jgi:hypothetical protein